MAILIETMRREGFELTVGRPEVIFREENGKRLEPIEDVFIDCEEAFLELFQKSFPPEKDGWSTW